MMSDLTAHNIELYRLHMLDMFPSTSHNHPSATNGPCFVRSKVGLPADVMTGCGCGRLIYDLQTPAQAKILMVCEEDLLAQTSRPVSPA